MVNNGLKQSDIELIAEKLDLSYEFIEARGKADCLPNKSLEQCNVFQLSLTMPIALDKPGWQVYFSHQSPIVKTESHDFSIEKINADLYRLYAKEKFKGFEPDKTMRILLITKAVQSKSALSQPNFYVMAEGLKATAIISSLSN